MQGLDLSVIVDEEGFLTARREDSRSQHLPLPDSSLLYKYLQRIEVVAKGKTFKGRVLHSKDAWYSEKLRSSDEELVKKFTANASRILPLGKASKAAQTMLKLEKLGNAAELMEVVAP
jgi:hypothetical protein